MTDPTPCTRCGQVHTKCSAHSKRTGQPCAKSPMTGQKVCASHGGATPQAREAAVRRLADEQTQRQLNAALTEAYGDNIPAIDPAEAMLNAVSWKYAEVQVLRRIVGALDFDQRTWGRTREKTGGDDRGTTEEVGANIWWRELQRAEEQLVRFAAAARSNGVEERRVRVAEDSGRLLAGVVRAILDRLQLTPEQRELVPVVVPEELRRIAELGGGSKA